jgi:ribosomal-protein-alanine N-acetyltransferase
MKTEQLELVPHAPWHLRALMDGREEYTRSFGVPPADGLREFFFQGEVSAEWLAALEKATELEPWTHGYALVHPEERLVVGVASYKGPPDADGAVEIAYGVAPGYQGRGFATEAARALTEHALRSGEVSHVLAHTLPEPNASTRVLAKCGFAFVGEVVDPEDGPVWRWELRPA